MNYSIDTSVLIEAWERHYPPDVFPNVWEQIEKCFTQKKFRCAYEVYREIEHQSDELRDWAKERKKLFVTLDAKVQHRARSILTDFPTLAKAQTTRREADPFVIALALAEELTVVTYERSKRTQPKIPDVCAALKVKCITPVELFRNEKWVFERR